MLAGNPQTESDGRYAKRATTRGIQTWGWILDLRVHLIVVDTVGHLLFSERLPVAFRHHVLLFLVVIANEAHNAETGDQIKALAQQGATTY